tara:strand:+ start:1164 stop:1265 length:102 start_codon:yes stop_codon:yes gene_type:complete
MKQMETKEVVAYIGLGLVIVMAILMILKLIGVI